MTMHANYAGNKNKLKKDMDKMLSLISFELEKVTGKKYSDIFNEIWNFYETEFLERFPYIDGKRVSGMRNLTATYVFVAMGETLKNIILP